MKKLMINTLTITALLQSQLIPLVATSSPMEDAEKIVQAHRELAQEKALVALNEDFNFAMSEMLKEVLKRPDVAEIKKNLFTEQEQILKGLNNLINLKEANPNQLKEQVTKAMEQYKAMVSKRFDISFRPAETQREMRESLILANQVLGNFEKNCASGKGIGGLNNSDYNYPSLPKAEFSINMSYSTENGIGFNSSGTFTGTEAEKKRNEVANVALGATSIVSSIAYSGSTGATVVACQAAAPFMLVGGAAIALGVMYMNQMERIKMQNEIVKAEMYVFHESADDRDIAKYYSHSCKNISKEAQKLRTILIQAINNPEELLTHYQESSDWESDLATIADLLRAREELYNQTLVLLDQHKKSPSDSSQAQIHGKVAALKNLEDKIKKEFTPEKVANIMISFIVKQDQDFKNSMDQAIWKSIDLTQRKAFEKVLGLVLTLQKKNFQKFLNLEDDFGLEGQAADRLFEAKRKFKEVLTLQIKGVFGRAKTADITTAEQDLKTKTKTLLKLYILNPEVAEFGRNVKALLGGL